MASEGERGAMRRAVELAARGLGRAYPNPAVGAVVLDRSGTPVGEGTHLGPGTPHAEVVALGEAGLRATGGTVVVTLEPCGHHGRTGPCAEALLAAGIGRVVYAVDDPNAAHGGADTLRAAGVDVESGVGADLVADVDEPWRFATAHDRPFVTWKLAASLDGRTAAADGSSRWITGEAARADAHRLRAECDAVLVGVGTVLADDCHLTARTPDGALASSQPLRVVVDSQCRTPASAKVLDGAARTLVATTEAAEPGRVAALRETKADVVALPAEPDTGRVDLGALLRELRRRDVVHVLAEGGPTLTRSLAEQRLVDRVVGYVAPCVLGAAGTIDDAWRLRLAGPPRTVGDDVRLVWRP